MCRLLFAEGSAIPAGRQSMGIPLLRNRHDPYCIISDLRAFESVSEFALSVAHVQSYFRYELHDHDEILVGMTQQGVQSSMAIELFIPAIFFSLKKQNFSRKNDDVLLR